MNKIFRSALLYFVLIGIVGRVEASSDFVFIDRMFVSDSAINVLSNIISPGPNVNIITNKDDIIFYTASIGVINPTKNKYDVEIICIDSKGNVVIKGTVIRKLSKSVEHVGGDVIRRLVQTVGLDPQLGVMVSGQLLPLKSGNDYFIKLFFEKKLVGVTKFTYKIVK